MRKIAIFLIIALLLLGCTKPIEPKPIIVDIDEGATSRGFFIGTSGYAPANFPSSSSAEVQAFWSDVGKSGELFGVHTDWKETGIIAVSSQFSDLVLVLGFQKPEEWENDVEELKDSIRDILRDNPRVKYLAIGNEVNTLYEQFPNQFDNFVSAYKEVYQSVKAEFPNVKVFTTFQLEAMKGKGYLTGKAREEEWFLLSKFGDSLDIAGFTTYSYFDYTDPDKIPSDYYGEIKQYTNKPVAFTEIGWPARSRWGGKLSKLNEQGFTGSEKEQVDFLNRFLDTTKSLDLEFVNWIFINDIVAWKDGEEPKQFPLFDSIGLKYHDGTAKEAWNEWLKLKST
ncbi:MAG TPA: hypothetical protein VJI46_04865 [Candidatus Nanoarchaeia archaeon]|nr:hypothetical protein [Candidatus Nanoarchaeia archaeon]